MAKAKKKIVRVTVELSVDAWMTPAQVRKEVRTRINELTEYGFYSPGSWGDTAEVRAKKISRAA